MLQNAYLLANIGADTAENEPNFAKHCRRPTGTAKRRPTDGEVRDANETVASVPPLTWPARGLHGHVAGKISKGLQLAANDL